MARWPQWRSLAQTVGPTIEPVTLDEARLHCAIIGDTHNDTLIGAIKAAREWAEETTRRQAITAAWVVKYDKFPCEFILPRPPLQSVTSITYVDTNGITQTVSSSVYVVDTASQPGRIYLAYQQIWPTDVRVIESAVTVTYVAGWATREAVPVRFKQAMKLLIGHWFEHPDEVITGTIQGRIDMAARDLLGSLKIKGFD